MEWLRSKGTSADHLVQLPVQAGTPRAYCPEYSLADFKDLQGWRFQNLSWQPVPVEFIIC